ARVEGAHNEGPRADGPRAGNGAGAPPPRIVPAPKPASTGAVSARPTFGNSQVERQRPPQPRQFGAPDPPGAMRGARNDDAQRPDNSRARPDGNTQRPDGNVQRPGPGPAAPREDARGQRQPPPQAQQPAPHPQRVEGRGPQQQQRLPGEPANRISPERAESRRQQPEGQQPERRGGGQEQPGR